MKVLVGYMDKFKEVGTVRIKNGKLVFDFKDREDKLMLTRNAPKLPPKEMMEYLEGRFAMSSSVVLKKEKGEEKEW